DLLFLSTAPPTTQIYPLSLHDALPISEAVRRVIVHHPRRLHERVADRRPHELEAARLELAAERARRVRLGRHPARRRPGVLVRRSEEHTSELQSRGHLVCRLLLEKKKK